MLNTAIVENSTKSADRLIKFLDRFSEEHGEEIRYTWYQGTHTFLSEYHFQFDLVFMDIELDDGNGMETAMKLRKRDPEVTLIFITHLAQYAVQSYEVDALDYILKPVGYPAFALKMLRAVRYINKNKLQDVMINSGEQMIRLSINSIKYVEIYKHHIVYHTEKGDYETYGVLKTVEEVLPKDCFFRLGSSHIVNLRQIDQVNSSSVVIEGKEIPVSRLKKKKFMEALHKQYLVGR